MSGTRKVNQRLKKALRPKEESSASGLLSPAIRVSRPHKASASASASSLVSPSIHVSRPYKASQKVFEGTPRPLGLENVNNSPPLEAKLSPVKVVRRRPGIHSAISAALESPDRRSNLGASSRSMSVANSMNTERSHHSHFGVTSANNRRTVKRNATLGPQTTRANQLNALRQAIQRQEAHQTKRRQRLKACIKRMEQEDEAEASRIRKMAAKLKTA